MADQTLECKDCSAAFIFTASEQDFYKSKNFEPPKRCAACRAEAKRKRTMGQQ